MLTSQSFVRMLLESGALHFSFDNYYEFSSGIRSPIYCDNRILLGIPAIRSTLTQTLCAIISSPHNTAATGAKGYLQQNIPENWNTALEVIVGTATAGIPWAALCADRLALPLSYARPAAKKHGTKSIFEGSSVYKKTLVIIEDLITTGGSVCAVLEHCKDQKAEVRCILSLFNYSFAFAAKQFEQLSCPVLSLGSFPTLLSVAEKDGYLNQKNKEELLSWHKEISEGKFSDSHT